MCKRSVRIYASALTRKVEDAGRKTRRPILSVATKNREVWVPLLPLDMHIQTPFPSIFRKTMSLQITMFLNINLQICSCHPFTFKKVVKSATKIVEIVSQIKIQCPKIIWTWAFSVVRIVPREVTIFLGIINF